VRPLRPPDEPFRVHAEALSRPRVGLLARGWRRLEPPALLLPSLARHQVVSRSNFPSTVAGPRRTSTGFPFMPQRAPEAIDLDSKKPKSRLRRPRPSRQANSRLAPRTALIDVRARKTSHRRPAPGPRPSTSEQDVSARAPGRSARRGWGPIPNLLRWARGQRPRWECRRCVDRKIRHSAGPERPAGVGPHSGDGVH
jgi:hypothetical protein